MQDPRLRSGEGLSRGNSKPPSQVPDVSFRDVARLLDDKHFSPVAHPFGETVGIDALAEAKQVPRDDSSMLGRVSILVPRTQPSSFFIARRSGGILRTHSNPSATYKVPRIRRVL